ncbi:ABC transporter ATP-binding protein [Hoeflea sp. WL0058]|uniref:ABC transporter ATP-binding protein n=1 Tax=Flavimaribacter sediminis TaxID=2865987 RepID=A0AAE2ZHY8_9HYPH|nr:ABC transporter ATP-binding protein [Flavimaribacter sediminis]MBW8636329.1 ABC transporter ATP-binding protein [Flavimaribacter sediminis]
MSALLDVRNVETFYGPIMAIAGVSLAVNAGQIVTVLGANGAGKSTLLKTISGAIDCRKGQVLFEDKEIQNRDPDVVAARGIGHVPEGRDVFPFMTVEENLLIGAYGRGDRDAVKRDFETVYQYFPDLKTKKHDRAGFLSGGQQQMLAIGRAFMGRPRLMLLDEPSLGLAPLLTQTIFQIIRRINGEQGVAVLLVEQNAHAALEVAEHGFIMEVGRIVMDAPSPELMASDDVKEFYLGQSSEGIRGERRWKKRKTWR